MTPVADAEPSTAFSDNQAELEQMRDAVTSLTAGVRRRPRQCIVGTAAAVANAVYNATGVRVRDLPIAPAKLVGRLSR